MNRPITISLSPNTQPDDVSIALKTLFSPWKWRNSEILDKVSSQLSAIHKGYDVALTSSGRQALTQLLAAYDIKEGDQVIIQAFTCIAVPAAIKWAGATPVYADINDKTYNLNPEDVRQKITDKTKAIIVQHTFGIPGPVNELKELAKQNNIVLIEDCAHSLGATYQGEAVGTLADAAFFSFGRDKVISSVFGGAVISGNKEIVASIKSQQEKLPYPSFFWVKQQLLHPILFSFIVPTYFKGSLGKIILIALQKLHLLSKAVEQKERTGAEPSHINKRYSPALAHLLHNQLQKLSAYNKRRRTIASIYLQDIKGQESITVHSSEPIYLRYPLKVSSPADIHAQAKSNKIFLGDWYDAPLAPSDCSLEAFDYVSGSCPIAERVSQRIINLPTYPLLSDEQVREVVSLINSNTNS